MATEKKKYVDNFYKLLDKGRSQSKRTLTIKESTDNRLLSTSSTFYNLNNKSESYPTLIQMLKSDLFQIQDMINLNSKDIKMFKLLSKTPGLSKKLTEIEQNKSVQESIEKISDISQRNDKINKIYGIKDNKQLIQKIFFELNLYELLLGKIHDFFLLMKLSLHKDDTYQETMSKIISMKDFIDKTVDKLNEKSINQDNKNNDEIKENIFNIQTLSEFLKTKFNDNGNNNIKDILLYIIKLINNFLKENNKNILNETNIEINFGKSKSDIEKFEIIQKELIELIKKSKLENCEIKAENNKIKEENENLIKRIEEFENQNLDINNIKSQFESEKNELVQNIENSEKKYKELENEYNLLKEQNSQMISELNEFKQKESDKLNYSTSIENELNTKKEQILNLEKTNSELNNKINELNSKITELTNKIKELENAKNKTIDINESLKNSELMNIMKNYESQLKKIGNDLMTQNKEKLKDLENKYKSLQSKYDMIIIERENLKKNILYLKGKKYDPDSYEEVLKEQFETMRRAFVNKIDELNEELTDIKRDSRIKVYQLELELQETVKLKNNFLKQIINLQSQLDALNKEYY